MACRSGGDRYGRFLYGAGSSHGRSIPKNILSRRPKYCPPVSTLGDLLLSIGRPQQALVAYDRSMKKNPNRFTFPVRAAQAASQRERKSQGRRALCTVVKDGHCQQRPARTIHCPALSCKCTTNSQPVVFQETAIRQLTLTLLPLFIFCCLLSAQQQQTVAPGAKWTGAASFYYNILPNEKNSFTLIGYTDHKNYILKQGGITKTCTRCLFLQVGISKRLANLKLRQRPCWEDCWVI